MYFLFPEKIKFIKSQNLSRSFNNPEVFFIFFAIFFGFFLVFLIPPLQIPDENVHFYRAYEISEFKLVSLREDNAIGDYIPTSLQVFASTFNNIPFHFENKLSFNEIFATIRIPLNAEEKVFTTFPSTAIYSPIPYIPQAVGIFFARSLNLSPLLLMYSGRLCNLFIWIFLVYLAIKKIPIGKWLLLILALTPMSIFQASSLSADALVNAISFLLISIILKNALSDDNKKIDNLNLLLILILSICLSVSKQIYIFLPLICLIIPIQKFSNKRKFVYFSLIIMISIFIVNFFWINLSKNFIIPLQPNVVPTEQIIYMINNPLHFVFIIINTLQIYILPYFNRFIGVLGWLDTPLPDFVYFSYAIILILIALIDNDTQLTLSRSQKSIVGFIFCLSTGILFAVLYIEWNPVGNQIIEGLQGRNFIPIMPLLLLLLSNNWIKIKTPLKYLIKSLIIVYISTILLIMINCLYLRYYSQVIPFLYILVFIVTIEILAFYLISKNNKDNQSKDVDNNISNYITKKSSWAILLIALLILSSILIGFVGTGTNLGISQPVANQPVREITANLTVGQSFYSTSPNLESIDICMATYARINKKDIIFHLKSSPESLNNIVLIKTNAALIENNEYHRFKFSSIKESANRSYYFYIESPDSVPGNAITIWSSKDDVYSQGSAYINSKPINGDLTFNVYYASAL